MDILRRIILNRNIILILSLVLGLVIGDFAHYIKHLTFYILAIVMTFSTTNIETKSMFPLRNMIKPMLVGIILNYLVFGTVIIILAYILMPTTNLFLGFVVIAATPPGVAVIPFSSILDGDIKYGAMGTLGAFISSLLFAPLILNIFSNSEVPISSFDLFITMIELVVLPLFISRFLLYKPILPSIKKYRGKVVDFGFAIIIFTAIGLNRQVLFSNFEVFAIVSFVLFISLFVLGHIHELICKTIKLDRKVTVAQNLLLTIKSSGFAVVTAITLYGEESAIPSAILAIFVLAYLLYLSIKRI